MSKRSSRQRTQQSNEPGNLIFRQEMVSVSSTFTTVKAAFEEYLRRIELNPTRVALASQRYNAVKQQIESALPGKTVSQVGSFQRRTKVKPIDPDDPLDTDAIVCFGDAYFFALPDSGLSPQSALSVVRNALVLDGTYNLMKPESDAPTVVLKYADGFKIELIPCFRDRTGQHPRSVGPACYIVGTSTGSWVSADYDYDAQIISGLNQHPIVGKALVPSIKMIKAFLRGYSTGLKSFHVEILCTLVISQAILDWQARRINWGYQHVLAYFLDNVSNHLCGLVSIPGSYSLPIDSGLSFSYLRDLALMLDRSAQTAWYICALGDTQQALRGWRNFCGEPFPA